MAKVVIRQCPVWAGHRELAARVAAALRKDPGMQVELVDGDKGELSALVNGRSVIQTKGERMPSEEEVLAAVRQARQPATGAA